MESGQVWILGIISTVDSKLKWCSSKRTKEKIGAWVKTTWETMLNVGITWRCQRWTQICFTFSFSFAVKGYLRPAIVLNSVRTCKTTQRKFWGFGCSKTLHACGKIETVVKKALFWTLQGGIDCPFLGLSTAVVNGHTVEMRILQISLEQLFPKILKAK